MSLPKLIPPFRFAYVEKDLFRGAYPVNHNFSFLRTLKLKTMISMSPNPIDDDLKKFCEEEHIKNYYYSVPKFVTQVVITVNSVTDIINIICNKDNLPLYIHCINGGHTTGLVIMCLRKLQMWTQRAMINEFSRFINTFERSEEEFINNYKATFELTQNRPDWLRHLPTGRKSHPTLHVIFADDEGTDDGDDQDDEEDEEENQNDSENQSEDHSLNDQ